MDQALIVILGFQIPIIVVCIIGVIYALYTNKKKRSEKL